MTSCRPMMMKERSVKIVIDSHSVHPALCKIIMIIIRTSLLCCAKIIRIIIHSAYLFDRWHARPHPPTHLHAVPKKQYSLSNVARELHFLHHPALATGATRLVARKSQTGLVHTRNIHSRRSIAQYSFKPNTPSRRSHTYLTGNTDAVAL